jgi:phosphinothricin acetyltransferase
MSIEIKGLNKEHWTDVSRIYQEGIETGNATFEQNCPGWEEWDNNHRKDSRLIVTFNGNIIGWAALSDVSERCIYSGVCEASVYVGKKSRGRGVGQLLLHELIHESEKNGIWTLQAGVFPENEESLNLFKKSDFREVGVRKKIGKMNGKWRDVVLLERRSTVVGTN